jgi:hypothetical protein
MNRPLPDVLMGVTLGPRSQIRREGTFYNCTPGRKLVPCGKVLCRRYNQPALDGKFESTLML